MSLRSPSTIKEVSELKVYRGQIFAGHLRRTRDGCELNLADDFVNSDIFPDFTYRIAKTKTPYIYKGVNLPPFFAGLLPEGLRLKALVSELKTSEDDLFTLLAATGDRCIGDVYTIAEGAARIHPSMPGADEIDFYDYFEETLASGIYAKGEASLAGVQEKLSASMISFPVQLAERGKAYILKLNPKDKPNLTHNEWACQTLAQKCGLEACQVKLVYDKNHHPGLLVERFDRWLRNDSTPLMVHQEDACQFLDRYPADKYRLPFREICEGIKVLATAPLIEMLRCLQLYVFSYLIGNGDLHAKNISMQTEPNSGRVRLTPAYDLICTYVYKDQTMALKLDGRDSQFKRQQILDFAQRLGLADRAVQAMIDKLISRLDKHKDLLLEIPLLTVKQQAQIRNMLDKRMNDLSA